MSEESKARKSIKSLKLKAKAFWTENETKIVTLIGLILVAVIAFEFGTLQGKKWLQKPLIIEKPGQTTQCPQEGQKTAQGANLSPGSPLIQPSPNRADCALVGSKNSNKYHLPSCQWAKRIKPENIVCFKSAEDALAKNYQPDKNCIK